MAKLVPGKQPGSKMNRFEKGESGNPKGRPPLLVNAIIKQFKEAGYEKVSKSQVKEAYEYMMGLDESKIKEIASNDKAPMLMRIVARTLVKRKHGQFEVLEQMLDRAHGKAAQGKQDLSVSGTIQSVSLTKTDLAALRKSNIIDDL